MSIWQTKKWQEMLKKSEQVSEFFEINNIFIEKRNVALWEYWLFILWLDKNIINEIFLKDLKILCKKENCLFIQIELLDYNNIKSLKDLKSLLNIRKENNWFNKWYYKKFITPYTAVIDLEKSEGDILTNMKPKWRYNIKLATKKWVVAEIVDKTEENIKSYYDLMLETTSRDNFAWNSLEYYSNFLNSLEKSKLILAKKDWIVIAGWIFVFNSEVSIYYYWASTSKKEYRNLMAPYLVQWEAIKYAKNIKSKLYDFLWIATPWDNKSDLAWVTSFKKKLTWDIREVSNSYIFVNKNIKYFIINILRKIKKYNIFAWKVFFYIIIREKFKI